MLEADTFMESEPNSAQAPQELAEALAENARALKEAGIEITGPHGYLVGDRVRAHGLQKKPEYNNTLGTVDRLLDMFGMGRLAVTFDTGTELSLKASNVEHACSFCSAVFGAALMLCPTCEEVHLCAACKPQHMCEDNNGKVGISVDNQFTVMNVAAGSPADLAGIQFGDTIQSIDGVSTSDELVPSIKGKVGSHVTLTLCRPSTTNFTVTIIRGREPKSKRTDLEPMPGIRVVGMVSSGMQGFIYEVERDFSLAGEKVGVPTKTKKGLLIFKNNKMESGQVLNFLALLVQKYKY
jgi:membrane-associated protease RseP (regulator of RpoE activity)